jgi:hypothetical protein
LAVLSSPHSDADLLALESQHAALALWQERLRFERLHPGSAFGPDALDRMSADWLCLERHDELDSVEHRLADALGQKTDSMARALFA